MEFFATCAAGLERLLADELRALGCTRPRPLQGQVAWQGEPAQAIRACLWSRLASRVVAVLARFDASDSDALYQGVHDIAWEDQLADGASLAVSAHGTTDQLKSTHFVAQRAKDAVVDRVRERRGARPPVDVSTPDLRIVVRLARGRATAGIDLAGAPLFHRLPSPRAGHRPQMGRLRPDIAAALLATCGFYGHVDKGPSELLTLFCGTGEILAEAAAIATGRAAGLLRHRWGFEGWAGFDPALWDELLAEADGSAEAGARKAVSLAAFDTRTSCQESTEGLLRELGIKIVPRFLSAGELASFPSHATATCDLSWIGLAAPVERARALAVATQAAHGGRPLAVLAPEAQTAVIESFGKKPESTVQTMVGKERAAIMAFCATKPLPSPGATVHGERLALLLATSDQLAARLAKTARLRLRWARRTDVSCYRIYDADLPDYNVSVDVFEDARDHRRWLQVYEYAPPKGIDPVLARGRLLDALSIAAATLHVEPAEVFVRVRRRDRGGSQYAKETRPRDGRAGEGAARGRDDAMPDGARIVSEGGLSFEVNPGLRLDCGLFLDHRMTRGWIRDLVRERGPRVRFLNLFAYTGTASCYAADGGARTTTVDLSRPSLAWARRNMVRNGFTGRDHSFVQADVLSWVREERRGRRRWDLIFCDVPTFSNSSRMGRRSFDVQRDHAELLINVSRLLSPEGICLFSCNLRTFRMDTEALARAGVSVEDVTAQTIPEDFSRTPTIHRCFVVRRPHGREP